MMCKENEVKNEGIFVTISEFAAIIGMSPNFVRLQLLQDEKFKQHVYRHNVRYLIRRKEALEAFESMLEKVD